MSTSSSVDDAIRVASQITVTYCGVYSLTFISQLIKKLSLYRRCKREGKVFDRYTAIEMRDVDRINANMLEWTPIFLGLLWCLALNGTKNNQDGGSGIGSSSSSFSSSPTTNVSLLTDTCVKVSWMYVGFRIMYFGLVLKYGVSSIGRNMALYGATFPAYGCLMYLMVVAVNGLF